MDYLTLAELRSLFETRPGPSVSIFLKTHRAGREIRQDPIRLKNLLRDAESRLVSQGLRSAEALEMLEPAQELLENEFFWHYQDEGLALFFSRGFYRHFRLPLEFLELVTVSDRFHVKPLLPLFSGDGRFFLLALSQNSVKLFEGTRYTLSELALEGVPHSLKEALRRENQEKQLQVRTVAAGSARSGLFHGHGGGVEEAKQDLLHYFREVDKGLRDLMKDQRAPLVLAGVEYLHPIYREASTCAGLLEEGVAGNPEALNTQQLHSAALRVVRPHFDKAQKGAAEKLAEFCATGRCSTKIREILPAAAQGRVESVFLPIGVQQWGTFDPEKVRVRLSRARRTGDEDLLNLVAIYAIFNRSSVYAVPPAEVPGRKPVAALFRY